MNTLTKKSILLLLLSGTFILPACGSKEVKSEKVPETVLKSANPAPAPPMVITPTVVSTPTEQITASAQTYTKHVFLTKHHALSHEVPMMAAATPLLATPTTSVDITTTSEMPEKKTGSHWPLIVAGIALVAAIGFYLRTKKVPPHDDFPLPPMGGLSPVSGFTAMRNKVKPEASEKSIWNKKLF